KLRGEQVNVPLLLSIQLCQILCFLVFFYFVQKMFNVLFLEIDVTNAPVELRLTISGELPSVLSGFDYSIDCQGERQLNKVQSMQGSFEVLYGSIAAPVTLFLVEGKSVDFYDFFHN